jgi:Do/DeqQ family serine protease
MKITWKLLLGFILVSLLSAFIAVGTYSHLNKSNRTASTSEELFNQGNFSAVGFTAAAECTDFTKAAEQSINGVVHIKSIINLNPSNRQRGYIDPFDFFFGNSPFGGGNPYGQKQLQPRIGFGSGVIISTDGYIVTNNHVVVGTDEVEVTTNNNKTYKAKLVGRDEATDIALLKIDGKDFPVIPFGDSDALKVGEWVLAVGNPFNLNSTVTAGIVSAKSRGDITSHYGGGRTGQATQRKIESYIQTDAAVNPGNSGGALVNTRGELVGINTLIYSETGNYVGYSFAVPVSIVKKVVTDIRQYGTVQRAMLGVFVKELAALKEENSDVYGKLKVTEGVYIDGFSSNSTAKKAGIEIGDVITVINGKKVKNFANLQGLLSRYNPGDKVNIQIQRGNSEKTFNVELKNDQGTTEVVKYQSPEDILGASFKELSKDTKMRLGVNFGVEVTDLSDGKLKAAGIKNGFIILTANETRVSTSGELIKIVQAILKQEPDNRGLFIRGLYPNVKKVEYLAIDLNN